MSEEQSSFKDTTLGILARRILDLKHDLKDIETVEDVSVKHLASVAYALYGDDTKQIDFTLTSISSSPTPKPTR